MTTLRIGDLARLGGVSVRMLRHYHELDLLVPVAVDEATGHRFYGADQLGVLRRILELKDLGLSLDDVGRMVGGELGPEQTEQLLLERRGAVEAALATGRSQLEAIDRELGALARRRAGERAPADATAPSGAERDGELDLEVELIAAEARLVAQLSAVADSWAPTDIGPVIQPLYPELVARMGDAGVAVAGPSTAWYEDTADGRVLVHATLGIGSVPAADPASLGFEVIELPAVDRMASAIHRGPMDDCDRTYGALLEWIDRNGLEPNGYSREVDLECGPDGPLVTALQVAVTDRGVRR